MTEITIPAGFTLDELLAVLDERPDLAGFRSRAEWQEQFGVSEPRMVKILQQAKKKGILEMADGRREALDGTMRRSPLYRFKLDK